MKETKSLWEEPNAGDKLFENGRTVRGAKVPIISGTTASR
jgi:hypothetical protein